jgi:hypothetical protein
MQDDVPTFTKREHSYQEIAKSIMRSHSISLEEFTRKVVTIQRAWKRLIKRAIISKYKLLFRLATDKLVRESHEISNFAAESAISDIYSADSGIYNVDLVIKQQLASALPLNHS